MPSRFFHRSINNQEIVLKTNYTHWSRMLLGSCVMVTGLHAHAAVKMDATLSLLIGQSATQVGRQIPRSNTSGASTEVMVPVTIRFNGSPFAALQALGVKLGSVSGNIVTANVPLSQLQRVTEVEGVVFVEASKALPARLAVSVPATGATSLRTGQPLQWTGATGQGVVVGIIDDGLDFRHKDFRKADGSTRLLSLWDMREAATGAPPAGFNYGKECTTADLNAAIAEGTSSVACQQPSTGNHGTHVGGIAVGNGQATGNGMAAFRHIGMAPMADIISANGIAGGVNASNAVIDAINYIKAKAAAAGKPAVVNLSLGSYYGNRDGTSNYETALSNAVGAGFIITAAAGNEGADPIRAEAALTEGGSVSIGYRIPGRDTQSVQMWYPGTHRWSVKVTSGQCATELVPANTPSYSVNTACGTVDISNNDVNALNGDREVMIRFSANGDNGPVGEWQITVQSVQGAGTVSMVGGEDSNGGIFTSHVNPVTTQILTDTCSATHTICVGAYVTRQEWLTLGGQSTSNTAHGAVGDVAIFSSRGPRRNCSVPEKCPPVAKPEILAPGAMIQSALGQDAKDNRNNNTVEADGEHIAYNGTSMATPHVTGAVALMLQKTPGLTAAEVKQLLFTHLQRTSFTPANLPAFNPNIPNPANADVAWGYGIMDIAKAFAATPGTGVTPPTVEAIFGAVSGNASGLTVGATITPLASERAANLQAFVAALLPNGGLFMLSQGQWQPVSAGLRAYGQFTGNQPYNVQVFNNLAHAGSGLGGTMIFVGYGIDANDMITGQKFKLVHTLGD